MKIAIVVPARQGSKGIIHKNRQKINGISIFRHALLMAKQISEEIKCSSMIIPATDDKVLIKDNFDFPTSYERPKWLSTDTSTMYELLIDILDFFSDQNFTEVIILQPTTPQREIYAFNKVWAQYIAHKNEISCLCSVSAMGVAVHELVIESSSGDLSPLDNRLPDTRRQDAMSQIFYDDGAFYIVKVSELRHQKSSLPKPIKFAKSGLVSVTDIDEPAELNLVRLKMKMVND